MERINIEPLLEYLKPSVKEALEFYSKQYQRAINDNDHFMMIVTKAKIEAWREIEARIDFYEREYGENQD